MMTSSARIIKASNKLQMKAGTGEIDTIKIARAELILQNNSENFSQMGLQFLSRLEAGIERARNLDRLSQEKIEGLVRPVMELKANAKMFKFDLVTELANIMLGFLENLKTVDYDAIEIVSAHHRTLHAIFFDGMRGPGGERGRHLCRELEEACQRHFKRNRPA